MHETLQEFINSRGASLRVDRAAGVIRGVKILGLTSRNGRVYLPAALAGAVALYEGAKVNVNHPKGAPEGPRDYQDRIGVLRGVVLRAGEGLYADFHFNPEHALAGQLTWDAEHQCENVGFSHNVQARVTREAERVIVEAITKVQSVDLVADPATTRGLFEEAAPAGTTEQLPAPIDLTEFRSTHPELIAQLEQPLVEQLAALTSEVDRLRARALGLEKRDLARRLLHEAELPIPDGQDPWARAVVSEAFFDALLQAPDERQMRRLIEERSRLVQSVRQWPGGSAATRPVSREQQAAGGDLVGPADARSFARAIT